MSNTTRDRAPPKSLTKLISEMSGRHHGYQIFSDFVEMAAISISNAVDRPQFEKREERYLQIAKRYSPEEIGQFPKMFGELVNEMEAEPSDLLGRTFHELELHNKYAGQYFTPFPVCQMMAKMTLGDDPKAIIEERGFLRASEPCVGSGAMVIALALALKDEGINYQQHLHVTAIDVDLKCVHMAFLQFSLLHIPAVIVHGNALSLEEWSRWKTPAHILGGWSHRLKKRAEQTEAPQPIITIAEPEKPQTIPQQPASQLSLW